MIPRPCIDCRSVIPSGTRCRSCERRRPQYDRQWQRIAQVAIALHPFCVDCGATEDLTADHRIPRSRGGRNELANVEVRCRSCNSKKGAR